MKLKAIPIEGYYVMVSNEQISGNGFRWDSERNSIGVIDDDDYYNKYPEQFKKIIAVKDDPKIYKHYPGLPLFDAPWEVDVEKMSWEEWEQDQKNNPNVVNPHAYTYGFKAGYNKHAETHPFTREDMDKAIDMALAVAYDPHYVSFIHKKQRVLASLQKPKVYEVIIEYYIEKLRCENWCADCKAFDWGMCKNKYQPKLTNNKITILSWKEI